MLTTTESQELRKEHRWQLFVWLVGFLVSLIPFFAIATYTREKSPVVWVMSHTEISYICVALTFAAFCDWVFKKEKTKTIVLFFDCFFAIVFCAFYIVVIIAEHEQKPFDQSFMLVMNCTFLGIVLFFHSAAYLMNDIVYWLTKIFNWLVRFPKWLIKFLSTKIKKHT